MSKLDLQVRFEALDKLTKPFKNILSSSNKLVTAFDENKNSLVQLNNKLKSIGAYKKHQQALIDNKKSLVEFREKARNLQQQLIRSKGTNISKKQTDALRSSYDKTRKKIEKLTKVHSFYSKKVATSSKILKQASINTKNLASAENVLQQSAIKTNNILTKQAAKLEQVASKQNKLNKAKQKYRDTMVHAQNLAIAGYTGMSVGRKTASIATSILRPGISFGEQMSAIQAKLRLDKKDANYQLIRKQAMRLGSSTTFSASEVGAGQEFLAMAGFTAKDILASMGSVLNLAKASGTDLAKTADITSNIAGAFKIDPAVVGNIEKLADVLTYTTTTANVDMEMLGDTMQYLAQAKDLNLGLEQAAAMAGLLGNVGIQGTMAGTTLRAMLNNLSAPAKAGKDAMKSLGVTFADTGDNAKDFIVFLTNIAEKTKTMGNTAKAAALKAIFGKNAVSGVTELVNQAGGGKLNKYYNDMLKLNKTAEKMAGVMSDNVAGEIKAITSAWEGLNIAITETNTSPLRKMFRVIANIIRATSKWIKENPKISSTILTLIGVIGGLVGVMGTLLVGIAGILGPFAILKLTLKGIGIHAASSINPIKLLGSAFTLLKSILIRVGAIMLANPILLVITAIAGAAYLIYKNWRTIVDFFKGIWANTRKVFTDTLQLLKTDTMAGISKIISVLFSFSPFAIFYKLFQKVVNYFKAQLPESLKAAISNWDVLSWFKSPFLAAINWLSDKFKSLPKMFTSIFHSNPAVEKILNSKKNFAYGNSNFGYTKPLTPITANKNKSTINQKIIVNVDNKNNDKKLPQNIATEVQNALNNLNKSPKLLYDVDGY